MKTHQSTVRFASFKKFAWVLIVLAALLAFGAIAEASTTPSSDYRLAAVERGTQGVPAPVTYFGGLALVGLLVVAHAKAVLKKKQALAVR